MGLEKDLKKIIGGIRPLRREAMEAALARQESLAKVPGSLGYLEKLSVRLAGITGRPVGNSVKDQGVIIMSGDNGVVEEGVASAPQTVTLMQTINFTKRTTGIGSQAKYFGIDVLTVDVGIRLPVPREYLTESMLEEGKITGKIVDRRIADGTRNLSREPAMDREEALKAIFVGIEAARAMKDAGKEIIGVGEMGIGNSTPAAVLICKFTGVSPEEVVGRGGGLDDEGLSKKIAVVRKALSDYESADPIEMARCAGSFEICGMAGAYIGGANLGLPLVADGYISIAAALLACEIAPGVKDYLFTSHRSQEAGYYFATEKLGIEPLFDLGMKLGEASGCPIAFKIMEAACAVMNGMATLDEGQIDSAYLEELKKKGLFI